MKSHYKLVRDNISEIILESGAKCTTRVLGEEEYKKELLNKLVEESKESLAALEDIEELKKELADVLEVLEAIEKTFKISGSEIVRIKNTRKRERGAFESRIFLEKSD